MPTIFHKQRGSSNQKVKNPCCSVGVRVSGPFVPRTIRTMDYSYHVWTICTMDHSYHWTIPAHLQLFPILRYINALNNKN